MSLEASITRLSAALEAVAAGLGGYVSISKPETPDETPNPDPEKKPRTGKKGKEKVIGKVHDDDDDDGFTKEDVRAKLQAVQKCTNPAQAKSILKGLGATTIGNLAKSKYKQTIDQCNVILDENDIPF